MIKKYLIICLLFFCVAFKIPTVNNFPLFGKLIIIDVGHGGPDPGAMYNEEKEKTYNLTFARLLKKNIENKGASVILTRDGDYDLSSPKVNYRKKSDFENRIKLINESRADIYISLHMNSIENKNYSGAQCFYNKKNSKDKRLASTIQKNINNFTNKDTKVSIINDNLYMYKRLNISGILIEYGFMSNKIDREKLRTASYRTGLSESIVAGIIEYFTQIS